MATVKYFQCPFCAFSVSAGNEDEIVKHAMIHKADRHSERHQRE